ncbi:MAG: hypothetical protein R6U78_17040, partial [Bacteroidales bacterium]
HEHGREKESGQQDGVCKPHRGQVAIRQRRGHRSRGRGGYPQRLVARQSLQKERGNFQKLTELRRTNQIVKCESTEMTVPGFFRFFLFMHHIQDFSKGIITDRGIRRRQLHPHCFPEIPS